MAQYVSDLAWSRLSVLYNKTPEEATLQDLYDRWMRDNGLTYGDSLGAFFVARTGITNVGDAEFAYWRGLEFADVLLQPVLWFDASWSGTEPAAPAVRILQTAPFFIDAGG